MGNNEIETLVGTHRVNNFTETLHVFSRMQPDEIGDLEELTELWLDSNLLTNLPHVRKK